MASCWYVFGGVALLLWSVLTQSKFELETCILILKASSEYLPYVILMLFGLCLSFFVLIEKSFFRCSRLIFGVVFGCSILLLLKSFGSSVFKQYFIEQPEGRSLTLLRNFAPFYVVIPLASTLIGTKIWKGQLGKLFLYMALMVYLINLGVTFVEKADDVHRQNRLNDMTRKSFEKVKGELSGDVAFWAHYERSPLYPEHFYLHGLQLL